MSLVDGVAGHCLEFAARRWPADIRDEQRAEWRAELHAMSADPGSGRLARTVRSLRFALSLAAAPPVEDENGVPRGWREFLPAWGRTLWPALVLVAMGMASGILASFVAVTGGFIGRLAFGDGSGYGDSRAAVAGKIAVGIVVCAAGAFLLGWFGTVVSRRLALVPAPRTAPRRAAAALGAVALVALGAALGVAWKGQAGWHDWFGFVLWTVVCAAVAVGAVFIARGGMRWLARILGIVGGLILLDLVAVEIGVRWATTPVEGAQTGVETMVPADLVDMAAAPLWFPLALGSHDPSLFNAPEWTTTAVTGEIGSALSGTMTTYLLALVFIVGYTVRTALAVLTVPATIAATPTPARRRTIPLRPRLAALAGTTAALAVWAWTVSFTASAIEPRVDHPELLVWGFELRLASILLAMLALAFALNGRGRPLVPAFAGGTALLIADIVLSANDIPDPTTFAVAAALAAGTAWTVWWLSQALAGTGPDAASARRGQVLIALLASYAAPLVFLQTTSMDSGGSAHSPDALRVGTAVVAAAMIGLGMVAATSARVRPLARVRRALLVGLPTVLFAGIGLAAGGESAGFLVAAGCLALPMLVIAYNVVRWDRVRRPGLRAAAVAVLFVPAMAVQMAAVLAGVYLGGVALTGPLMEAAGTGIGHDGVPFFLGSMIFGVPLAIAFTRKVAPPPHVRAVRVGRLTTI
ncbi:hypothetical protein AB0I28_11455 [Phytomonospora sp. NPDC050363]|uniref:hypothetical protein n=1 Tax=Phytomonospora sp. NPDC050363 TaxID=3155642 RepID=UPI0033C51C28